MDSNDYSVHPAVIGRRVEVVADLDRVPVTCDGTVVADHDRVLGQAPDHHRPRAPGRPLALAHHARTVRPAPQHPLAWSVEARDLADYDTAFGPSRPSRTRLA